MFSENDVTQTDSEEGQTCIFDISKEANTCTAKRSKWLEI